MASTSNFFATRIVRASPANPSAFAFSTSIGRFVGAGVNFALGALVLRAGSLGWPVALTGGAFLAGLLIIPLAVETKGRALPD